MEANEVTVAETPTVGGEHHEPVRVPVNTKPVTLPSRHVTGRQIKEAAIAQGVAIELDFHLVEEAHEGHPARRIEDDQHVTVTDDSEFTANDGDDDS